MALPWLADEATKVVDNKGLGSIFLAKSHIPASTPFPRHRHFLPSSIIRQTSMKCWSLFVEIDINAIPGDDL